MEKLIVLGAKRFWAIGWCGSLQRYLRIGDVVIPTSAVSEEGTSRHYPAGNGPVGTDPDMNKLLIQAARELPVQSLAGAVWSTDAPYRETPDKVRQYSEQGVLAVEMEMSALMQVALFRSVAVAGLLIVSDELFDLRWHTGFSSPKVKKITRGRTLSAPDSIHGWGRYRRGGKPLTQKETCWKRYNTKLKNCGS